VTAIRGLFLTFEGPEGAGKTTQIALLAEALERAGQRVTRTREPGGDAVGERVREIVLSGASGSVTPAAELFLMAAARAQNVAAVVRPALERGDVVLCDRFTDSTLAYQGYGRGLPAQALAPVNRLATGGLQPDRTFLFDLPPAVGLARQSAEKQDRLDREGLGFHERVRAGFLAIAAEEPERVVVFDATLPVHELASALLAAVLPLLLETR
jgi:dTMP kinase